MKAPDEPKQGTSHDLERARQAVQRARNERNAKDLLSPRSLVIHGGLIAGIVATLLIGASMKEEASGPALVQACNRDDARCLGERALGQAVYTCTPKLEANAPIGATWDVGWTESALNIEGWYNPGTTLIFGGNRLVQTNADNSTRRIRYFCVTTTDGDYVKHGFPR